MSVEYERLAVLLEARVADFEKKIASATRNADRNFRRIEASAEGMRNRMSKAFSSAGDVAKTSLAGLFAGVAAGGVGGLVAGFASATKAVAELGDAAKTAGVSSKAFQEWRYVAEQARIPIDAMTDGLKELNLRADEFAVTGKGSAAEAFQRLGLTPQEVKERLKDPSEFLLLLIDRTKQLNDTAAGVRIFDELFGGTGGERMVSLLSQGEKGIRAQIKAANDLGIVIDDDLIKRAAELDAKFNTIVHTVGQNLKAAIVSASDSLVDFIDRWRATENQLAGTLSSRQAEVDTKRLDLENKILETSNNQLLTQNQRNKAVGQYRIELQKLTEESASIAGALGTKLPEVSKVTDRTFNPVLPPDSGSGGGSSREKAIREAERERQAVTDLIAELDYEYSLIGKTAAQQDKMNALRQAGAAATAEEQLAIASKVDAINRESEAYDKAKSAAADATSAARDFAGTLVDGFIEGASAAETLGNALKNLGSRLINSGLDSLFSGGGLFSGIGSIFGGGKSSFPSAPLPMYAAGTSSAKSGVALVGEKGPELVRFRGGEEVVPNHQLVQPRIPNVPTIRGGGGNSMSFSPTYHIDARGADAAAVARLQAGLDKTNREMQGRIESGVRSAQKRNVKF